MKIAMPADAPHLDARIADRLGLAPYLLVVDTEDMTFEAVPGPPRTGGPGAGIQIVTQALGMGARALLTGYISPYIARTLEKNGIEVITPVSGSARDAVEIYRLGAFKRVDGEGKEAAGPPPPVHRVPWQDALRRAANQFLGMFPILLGVILLVGLFQAFLPKDGLLIVFSGNRVFDTLWGACAGSVLAGNPLNSYVIGETLLELGVGFLGVTALMMSWVTVGLVQLPAEIAALGMRFAIGRNVAAFVITLLASPFIVWLSGRGW
jgi:predicted Fe-Mo cluster-binding NifX family protein